MTTQQYEDGPGTVAVSAGGGAAALLNGGGMTATARAASAREMAEVMAQVQVAQTVPRDIERALRRIGNSCGRYRFAKSAFYSFRRGGTEISGLTVKVARELAAAWGNFQYGLVEIDRDTAKGYSMMMAWAWDVETNTRDSTTFMVRAVRDLAPDQEGGERRKVPLFDERDWYENNANMGARRVRAVILATLPAWLADEAEELCRAAIERGPRKSDGTYDPLEVRLAKAVTLFADEYDVRKEQLEGWLGVPFPKWRAHDLVKLITLYEQLNRGERDVAEVFAPPKATADDVAAQAGARPDGEPAPPPKADPAPVPDGKPAAPPGAAEPGAVLTSVTLNAIETAFATCGWAGRGESRRVTVAAALAEVPAGRPAAEWSDLTEAEGQAALTRLTALVEETAAGKRRDALHDIYSAAQAARRQARTAARQAEPDPAASDPAPPAGGREPAGTEHAGADVPAAAADAALAGQAEPAAEPAEEDPPGDPDAPPDPDGPVTDDTLRALLTKITAVNKLRGTSAAAKARRLVIIGVLVTGHYHDFGDPARLTEAQAHQAMARFDELAATPAGRQSMEDVMAKVHDDAVAQRDQVDQTGTEGDGRK